MRVEPGRTLSPVDVARAALAEVGVGPDRVEVRDDGHGPAAWMRHGSRGVGYKALILARISEAGPEHLVRCHHCSHVPDYRPGAPVPLPSNVPCTPANLALIGVTCES